jgi:uncharacterized protein (DUF1499 family)
MICPDNARPYVIVNRVMKRLTRDGWVTPIPMPKDKPYLYMPNPTMIHTQSSKTQHFLSLVDVYIDLGQPNIYQIEPQINQEYRPDVYARLPEPTIIEVQRSYISHKKMQEKLNMFVDSSIRRQHDSNILWIISTREYKLKVPSGFTVIQSNPKEIKNREAM